MNFRAVFSQGTFTRVGAFLAPGVILGGAFVTQSENFWGTASTAKEYKYVVLGGGNASGYAAEQFLKKGIKTNELCIISEEPYVSYERPALSKAYLSPEKPARLPGFHTCVGGGGARQTPEWYKEKGVEFMTSTPITAADVKNKTLTTAKGEKIKYGKLIVATGARPMTLADFKVPGANLQGLFYLRNVEDADAMYASIQEARKTGNKKCLVVGGGYIGMECAAKLLDNDCDVTMVFPESRLMERLFTADMAKYYEDIFKAKGTKFVKGDGCLVTSVQGTTKATGVTLRNGAKLDADLIIVGTGARPNTELFTDQLQMAAVNPKVGQIGGINVNEYMQTSDKDVYAVGDVAAFPLRRYGGRVTRQEHVTHCRSSARQAVDHIMTPAETQPYDYLPFFYSRIFDLSWKYWGTADGEPVFFKDGKKIGSVWIGKDGKVTGSFLESGSADDDAALKKLADENTKVNPAEIKAKGFAAFAKA